MSTTAWTEMTKTAIVRRLTFGALKTLDVVETLKMSLQTNEPYLVAAVVDVVVVADALAC
jgi:hypothetical protein